MNAMPKLLAFAAAAAVVFGLMFLAGRALVPESAVNDWNRQVREAEQDHSGSDGDTPERGTGVQSHGTSMEGGMQ
ncbi:MAG: hypothetical protein KDB54_08010 [Solirubrobacterales bacterium]|nr:hypothetical protein [Solirubrobacterales bacterium]MCB0860586.1 hypothetical protein [Solirubrobacterales bacterium]